MAKYRVLSKSFIDNHIREEGEIIDYDGDAADNLELIPEDKPVKTAKNQPGDP